MIRPNRSNSARVDGGIVSRRVTHAVCTTHAKVTKTNLTIRIKYSHSCFCVDNGSLYKCCIPKVVCDEKHIIGTIAITDGIDIGDSTEITR